MAHEGDNEYVSVEEWERSLKIVSYCVLRVGPVLVPVLERVEREVERARREDPMVRARRHLEGSAEQLGHGKRPRLWASRWR